jgi:hypothetical protein
MSEDIVSIGRPSSLPTARTPNNPLAHTAWPGSIKESCSSSRHEKLSQAAIKAANRDKPQITLWLVPSSEPQNPKRAPCGSRASP